MHSSFYIETAGGKRKCRGSCDRDIPRGESCFVETYKDGMFFRKDNYHLKCALGFIDDAIKELDKHKKTLNELLNKKV